MKTLIEVIKLPFVLVSVLVKSVFLGVLWIIGAPIKIKRGNNIHVYRWFKRTR